MPRKTVNINLPRLQGNRKNGSCDPVVRQAVGSRVEYGNDLEFLDGDGNVMGRVVYTPDKPLSCGAVCYLELYCDTRWNSPTELVSE